MSLIYTKDSLNADMLFDKTINYQTMMAWEKPYMEALIDNLEPYGDVLEIGFGMGYSASQIQKYKIKSHTIIEMDAAVCEKLRTWAKAQKYPVNIIEGSWQDKLGSLGTFDCIFLDDAPNAQYPDPEGTSNFVVFGKIASSHVNIMSKMSWYCGNPIYWVVNNFVDWSCKEYAIDIPANCNYINEEVKRNKCLYMPKVIFTKGIISDIKYFGIDRYGRAVNITKEKS